MLNVLNQFKRIYNDDGRHDKSFAIDEFKLRASLARLKSATEELIKASQTLSDLLLDRQPPTTH
jgi:hypothetical protein